MSVQRNIELVKQILHNLDKKDYKDSHEQLVYELGYLIGLMAKLANEDSQVYHALKRTLEKLIEKRSRSKRLK
jgi:hypothetical protein